MNNLKYIDPLVVHIDAIKFSEDETELVLEATDDEQDCVGYRVWVAAEDESGNKNSGDLYTSFFQSFETAHAVAAAIALVLGHRLDEIKFSHMPVEKKVILFRIRVPEPDGNWAEHSLRFATDQESKIFMQGAKMAMEHMPASHDPLLGDVFDLTVCFRDQDGELGTITGKFQGHTLEDAKINAIKKVKDAYPRCSDFNIVGKAN